MLYMFYLDVAYVAMAIHVRCKCVFQMFQLFHLDVACFLSGCYICCSGYTCTLQVFYLFQTYVASVLSDVAYVAAVIHICCKRMFQLFHIVSVCCNRCSSLHALIRGQAHVAPGTLAPSGMVPHDRACSRLNTCACVLCSLPLSLAHWGTRVVLSLALGYARLKVLCLVLAISENA
jgi:hypothetical protein